MAWDAGSSICRQPQQGKRDQLRCDLVGQKIQPRWPHPTRTSSTLPNARRTSSTQCRNIDSPPTAPLRRTPYNTTMKYDQSVAADPFPTREPEATSRPYDYAYDTLFDANRVNDNFREVSSRSMVSTPSDNSFREQNELGGITQFPITIRLANLNRSTFSPNITQMNDRPRFKTTPRRPSRVRGIATNHHPLRQPETTFQKAFDILTSANDTADGLNSIAYVDPPRRRQPPGPTANKHHALRTRTERPRAPPSSSNPRSGRHPSVELCSHHNALYPTCPTPASKPPWVSRGNVTTAVRQNHVHRRNPNPALAVKPFNAFGNPTNRSFDVHVDAFRESAQPLVDRF